MADEQPQAGNQAQATTDRNILLQKMYIKDMSFESPKVPEVFTSDAQVTTSLNVGTQNRQIDEQYVEVTLTLTVESKLVEETVFLIEIVQAGVFLMTGYNEQERRALVGSFCPSTLFPFAREAVCDLSIKGGFPPLLLQPINFDALYAQAVQQRQQQQMQANMSGQPLQVQMPGADSNAAAASGDAAADSSKEGGGETH